MAGRIRDEDVALVREKAAIDDIVRDYVALKPAGGGSFKGLCPFHDERSPSFHVTPSRGMYYCFGCQEGGDVITFVQKLDHLTFAESVEKLAGRTGVTLRYEEGGAGVNRQQGQRTRLVEANKVAEEYFVAQLGGPDAAPARTFLSERGFDAAVATDFHLGFAPKSWDSLTSHLRKRGFSDAEMMAAGLVAQGSRGVYDRFRGRLIWPIRDLAGDVVGFGARRLLEDDEGPKYLNTPETPLYKKSQVLYGIDRARREIAKQQKVVVVEGYTDVMACQLAGVAVAVATCGTSFGADHIKVLRRLLMDDDRLRGEVIFTFDGDEAGRRAALKAFDDDQRFVAQTFVAVEPHGLDPCDLRQQHGDVAIRSLVDHRVPLFEFAIRSTLAGYDLESAEGRVAALRDAAPIVARIKDPERRAGHIVESDLVEEVHRIRIAAVLTTDSTLKFWPYGAPVVHGHPDESPDPLSVDGLKGRHSEDSLVEIGRKEGSLNIVAAEAPGGLGEVVGAEGEEVGSFGNLPRRDRSTRQLNHRANREAEGAAVHLSNISQHPRCLVDDEFQLLD